MRRRGFIFVMPFFLLAWFFVFSASVKSAAAAELPKITAGGTSSSFSNWKPVFSWPHTVTGADPVLLVTLHTNGSYISSVSYGGQPMSLAVSRVYSQAYNNVAVFIYYLANPAAGTHNIEVGTSFTPPVIASAITFNNVDTGNPINSAKAFLESTTIISHPIAANYPNSMLLDAVTYNKPLFVSALPASGQTQYFSNQFPTQPNDFYSGESYRLAEPVGTSTMGWVSGDIRTSVHAIVALNPKYKAETKEPVIIVPGIMGSWNMSGRWQLDPILHTYDNLVEALIAAGYKEDSLAEDKPTLFTFPYDWRQDNNITASLLKEKIQAVKAITGSNKVDIIAHSMGGLVTRSYVEGSDYRNDIDQVIFLGTPHQGSVDTYLKYGGAEFVEKWDWLSKYLFQTEAAFNGYLDLTDYIRAKVLTVEQLLPVFDYLKDKQPDNSWQLRPYPLNYPQNNYLENLNSQANINLLKQRVRITNIIGNLGASSTLNSLKVIPDSNTTDNKWQSGYPENLDKNLDSLEMGNGDGTVPLSSADSLDGVEIFKTGVSDHANLPTIMQKEIIKTLTGKEPTNYFNSKITSTIKRWVFFRVYSPVDFAVVDPDGRKIGKDFASSTEINQIPDAFYSGFNGQAEFVLIPNPLDGEYKVEVRGVANGGEYTLANSVIDGDKETTKEFSGSIAPEQERDFNIIYSAASENPLSELKPEDTTPPLVVINQPREGGEYPSSESLAIDYAADDDFSGLATTTIMIDGQAVATTTIHFFNYSLGGHTLTITVWDKAGNQAQAQVNFTVIDTVSPIITINQPVGNDKYLSSDNLLIDYSATDDFSGIATTTITIDGQEVATTTINLLNYSLGQHSLIITAIDSAGNQAQAQVNFTIIDIVPPVVAISKPAENDKYLHSGDLIIDFTATDDFSGIATTTIMIDGKKVATTTVDLFSYPLGIHSLIVQAVDKAGNQTQAQVNFEIIANIDSTIADIERIYELGWFKDKIYHALLEDAFKLLKIEANFFDKEQDLTEKLIRKTQDNRKLTDKQKQKLIEQYNKKLAELKKDRAKAIDKSLDLITKLLDKAKDKNQLNQPGYDIIIGDINYLRENL